MKSFSFPKSARLLVSQQFRQVLRHGKEHRGEIISVQTMQTRNETGARLGITVSKRFGKAHDRNRFKRCVRELFRARRGKIKPELIIHIKPLVPCRAFTFKKLQKDFNILSFAYIQENEKSRISCREERN